MTAHLSCPAHHSAADSVCANCLLALCPACISSHPHPHVVSPIQTFIIAVHSGLSQALHRLYVTPEIFPGITPAQVESALLKLYQCDNISDLLAGLSQAGTKLLPQLAQIIRLRLVKSLHSFLVSAQVPMTILPDSVSCLELSHGRRALLARKIKLPYCYGCGVCTIGHKLYVAGGTTEEDAFDGSRETYRVDLDSISLAAPTRLADMLYITQSASLAAVTTQVIFAAGGFHCIAAMKACEVYSISQNRWTHTYPLNSARSEPTLVVFNAHVLYCIGGAYARTQAERMDILEDAPWTVLTVAELTTSPVLDGAETGAQVSNRGILHLDLDTAWIIGTYTMTAQKVGKVKERISSSQSVMGWRDGMAHFVADRGSGRWFCFDSVRGRFRKSKY